MSDLLPAGVYTAHAMVTSGKTVVMPDTGNWFGCHLKSKSILLSAANTPTIVNRTIIGSTNLPTGVYTAHAMITSGKTVVTPDTGNWFGDVAKIYQLKFDRLIAITIAGNTTIKFTLTQGRFTVAGSQSLQFTGPIQTTYFEIDGKQIVSFQIKSSAQFRVNGKTVITFAGGTGARFRVDGKTDIKFFVSNPVQQGTCSVGDGTIPNINTEDNYVF